MLLQTEHAHLEAIREEVAFHTIRGNTVLGEYTFVEVLVATVAGIKGDGFGVRPFVALLAIHADVLALQRIIRQVVVEIIHMQQRLETLFLVAFGAVRSELPFMRILVTGRTVVHSHTCTVLENGQRVARSLMACETVGRLVFTIQFERGGAVIEAFLAVEAVE